MSVRPHNPQQRAMAIGTASSVAAVEAAVNASGVKLRIVSRLFVDAGGASFDDLPRTLDEQAIDLVVVSLPSDAGDGARRLARLLDQTGVAWRAWPTVDDILAGRSAPVAARRSAESLSRAIDPDELLGREPHHLDEGAIGTTIRRRTVLITGAGGSIGAELARRVAHYGPGKLVLVERSENALFEIDRAIAAAHPALTRAAELHDVTDAARTLAVVRRHKPDVVFHAAAHKHVPMMEDHPSEAIENNFLGTRSIVDAAIEAGAKRLVMVSTNKAVNPRSVMGATKRLAEMYIQSRAARRDHSTILCMVRFGNVLGSACSVLPIWSAQLAQRTPLTVTHPDMTRYFMTIPEAAGLVLQAAAMAAGGEVFVLDMGAPIHIVDLARRFIEAHGLDAASDVAIRFTGPRPGEKLTEEPGYADDEMRLTTHPAIHICDAPAPSADHMTRVTTMLDHLRSGDGPHEHRWQRATGSALLAALRDAVPEMQREAETAIAG